MFSSGWPSWSLALDSLGCRSIYSYVQDLSPAGLLEAKAVIGTRGWSSEKEMLAMLQRQQGSQVLATSVFIQGPFSLKELGCSYRCACEPEYVQHALLKIFQAIHAMLLVELNLGILSHLAMQMLAALSMQSGNSECFLSYEI